MNNYKINILEKKGAYAFLGIDYKDKEDVISNFDGRYKAGVIFRYEDTEEADEKYNTALRNTVDNGWKIVYNGDRNYG